MSIVAIVATLLRHCADLLQMSMCAGATNLRNLALWREFQGDEARSTALALSFGWPALPPLLNYFTVEANRAQFVNHRDGQLLRTVWAGRQQDPEPWGNRSEPTD
jgi:hypothetical protein